MFFEVLSYHFPVGATHVSSGGPVSFQWTFIFFPFSISFSRNYSLTLLVIDISTLVLRSGLFSGKWFPKNHFPNFYVCLSLEKLVNGKHFPVKEKFGLVSTKVFS